jgi:outer membrane immunogenic protein
VPNPIWFSTVARETQPKRSPYVSVMQGLVVGVTVKSHLTGAAIAATLLGTPAFAADMPVKAPPPPPPAVTTWTGFYLGINGGWSGGTSQDSWAFIDPFGQHNVGPKFNQNGGLAGVTYGANWQFGRSWVLGFEGDFDVADISGSYTNAMF